MSFNGIRAAIDWIAGLLGLRETYVEEGRKQHAEEAAARNAKVKTENTATDAKVTEEVAAVREETEEQRTRPNPTGKDANDLIEDTEKKWPPR